MKAVIISILLILGITISGTYIYNHSKKEQKRNLSGQQLSGQQELTLEELLIGAIEKGNKEEINLLIKSGAKTDSLQAAIALGEKDKVEKYLKQGEGLTYQSKTQGVYISLLSYGGGPYVWSYPEMNNLYLAVNNNQVEIAKLLIEYGADVNTSLVEGRTRSYFPPPLTVAVSCGNKEMVKLLLENGADVNSEGPYGNTALDYVTGEVERQFHEKYGTNVEYPKDEDIKQLLIKYGAKEGSHMEHIIMDD